MLRITYDENEKEIEIAGNSEGLKYLAYYCKRIIGKTTPAGHIHLTKDIEDLTPDSIDTILIYDPDLEE